MKNISVYVTIGLFLIGVIMGFGKLQANVSTNDKSIDKLEAKVESLTEDTTTVKANQESIVKILDKLDTKLEKISDRVGVKK